MSKQTIQTASQEEFGVLERVFRHRSETNAGFQRPLVARHADLAIQRNGIFVINPANLDDELRVPDRFVNALEFIHRCQTDPLWTDIGTASAM